MVTTLSIASPFCEFTGVVLWSFATIIPQLICCTLYLSYDYEQAESEENKKAYGFFEIENKEEDAHEHPPLYIDIVSLWRKG